MKTIKDLVQRYEETAKAFDDAETELDSAIQNEMNKDITPKEAAAIISLLPIGYLSSQYFDLWLTKKLVEQIDLSKTV